MLKLMVRHLSSSAVTKSCPSMADYKFVDVGANLTDDMYNGMYNGSKKHEPDLKNVLERSFSSGIRKIIVTSGNLKEIDAAANLARFDDRLFSTAGVHPTRCSEFEESGPQEYLRKLKEALQRNRDKVVAIGEFGLDYDRTKFCDINTQKKYFELQLQELAKPANLPLFLHCRAAAADLHQILQANKDCFPKGGVVHSFDGTLQEAQLFLDLGLYIGLNGCSLKTEENLSVVKDLTADRILLETDAPWCGIRSTHAGFKLVQTPIESSKKWNDKCMLKQRNEPHTIRNVLEVVAGVKETEPEALANQIYENSMKLFFSS